ncbi:MAG: sensor domain-containing diguanylate cyclase [Nitrospirae bacterium]|nr:sensor domain-containing diguanylate cyclase [Nitrospirota bacterium]
MDAQRDTERKQLKILTALVRVHHSIGADLELERIALILVGELTSILPCDGCAIMVFDENNVQILAEKGFKKMFGEKGFTTDLPAIKHIIQTKQSIYTGDITESQAASCVPLGCLMNSLICTPIIVDDCVRGIVHLDSEKKNSFTDEDLQFVELLAKEISIAVARSIKYSQVKSLAAIDVLTRCYNRRIMDEDLDVYISCYHRYKRTFSLMMIDIDWFKIFNDSHGHQKGDKVLKKIVDLFRHSIRTCDKVYRYGGEEFVILLPETEKAGAIVVAQRIQKAVELFQFAGEEESQPNKKITVSIGVASFPADTDSKESLIKSADSALYMAKQSGRNKVLPFSP